MSAHRDHASKTKLVDAAIHLVRTKGFAATTLDDIGREAGVTKGSLFHHFSGKDELALAAIHRFSDDAEREFAAASYHAEPDPLQRLLGYVDLRLAMLTGDVSEFTCLLGTMVQETYGTHPQMREACARGLASHVDAMMADLREAKRLYAPAAPWSPDSVGRFMQAVLQGSFIQAKAVLSPDVARENLSHLRRYVELLFSSPLPPSRKQPRRRRRRGD